MMKRNRPCGSGAAGRGRETIMGLHFGEQPKALSISWPPGQWERWVDSSESRWGGPGSPAPAALQGNGTPSLTLAPQSLVLFARREEEA